MTLERADFGKFLMAGGVITPQLWAKMDEGEKSDLALAGQRLRMQAAKLIADAILEKLGKGAEIPDEFEEDITEDEAADRSLDEIAEKLRRKMTGDEHLASGAAIEVPLESSHLGGYGGESRLGL